MPGDRVQLSAVFAVVTLLGMDPMATIAPDLQPADEAALLSALRAGDGAAFEQLVRGYGGRLLAAARRILGNEDDAREAVQDGFLSAVRSLDAFEGKSQVGTWLHRIVVNRSLEILRRRRRVDEKRIDDLLPAFQDDGHQVTPADEWELSSGGRLQQEETRALVRQAIAQLPERYREVLLMRDIEEIPTEETARCLGVTGNVVKTRLHRARQALRTLLDPHFRRGAL